MIFRNQAMAAPVSLPDMAFTTIFSGCSHSRRIISAHSPRATCCDIEREARKFTLREAVLVGNYER
jgi:hypothetical protein